LYKYLVSAIISIYNCEKFIKEKIDDLKLQTIFDRMQIVMINSNSLENEEQIIKPYLSKHPNITYLKTKQRETVYQAWNRGIKMSDAKYITNSNSDDRLRNNALEIMAYELDNHHDIALVYGNHFVTNIENHTFYNHIRSGYGLKPNYDLQIMLNGCHMGPFPLWRKSIHDDIGYFDETMKSAGDYDFWCRIALKYKMKHIPQFIGLYCNNFYGIVNGNMKISKTETMTIKKKYNKQFPPSPKNIPHDFYYLKTGNPFVNISIVTYNRLEFTKQCIESLCKFTDYPHVITVIDNHSKDGTKEYLKELKTTGVIKNLILLDENIGVAKASNIGWLWEPDAEYYLKLDNDIVFQKPRWLTTLVESIEKNKRLGAVGYNFESVSYKIRSKYFLKLRYKSGNLGGACILIPKRVSKKIGYWSEDYGLYGEEDADYGERIKYSQLLNAYMLDENIGIHLPSGKAAIIDTVTFKATDGKEEVLHKEYRDWKDDLRRKNIQDGTFLRNLKLYKKRKTLYKFPDYAFNYITLHYPEKMIKINRESDSLWEEVKNIFNAFLYQTFSKKVP